ncbi:Rne/Rng family ribonuclease [Sinomonas mesophila]|uniref:Rne/Rng family ribonuclease n=1 Tax=Sinomonas mesophila TaxID=1531955 RepID=UPI0009878529|nr:Rne/Rng family ribonuclease [Sinomonas mesophila]
MDIEQQAAETAPEAAPAEETEKPRRRTARRRTAAPTTDAATTPAEVRTADATEAVKASDAASDGAPAEPPTPEKPKRAPRSRKKAAPVEESAFSEPVPAEPVPDDAASAEAAARESAPVRSRRRASARAAAAQADSKSAAATPAPDAEARAQQAEATAPEPTAPSFRAKSSVRARRRAATSAPAAPAAAPTDTELAMAVGDAERAAAEYTAAERAAAEHAPAEQAAAEYAAAEQAPAIEPAPAAAMAPTEAGVPQEAPTAEEASQEQELSGFAALFSDAASPTSLLFQAPDLSAVVRPAPAEEPEGEEESEEDEEALPSRRRRRSRGRRGRSRGGEETGEEAAGEGEDEEAEGDADEVTSRRRRRRRRGEVDLELTGGEDGDPLNTVTRVRAPRTTSEGTSSRVQSVKGSTRLEAKKQRRRESRESGRRRHVITEAEFLARRESVDRQMVVRQKEDRIQIAVLEDGVLAEHFVSKTQQDSLIGNVYLGKVQNVLPSMEAAFVDIGRGRNAVLYAGEVNWDAAGLDGAPRRIENALKSGDSVLVQVTKDPVGHKGARLTSQISLPGRYLVYVPGGSMTGISRKLPDVERNRLKRILKDRLPEDAGVIVRTAAEGASEEELTHDINRLRAQWESIQSQASSTKVLAPELLYGEPDLTIKVVRDVFNEDFSKLIVSGDEAWDTIEAYVTYVAPDLLGRLEKYQGEDDVFAQWRIDEQIHKALDRKVFLPSGGSLVIDRTEAMTVIDVNTGKFTGSGGNLEETVTKNNLEAAEEIVRQLRLRDVGGIIVIDFIDMVLESNRDLVLRRLVECLGRDRTKHQVAEVTSLGLVQMTRKRMGTGLLEVFSETCEVCAGRGVITYEEPVERGSRPSVAAVEPQQARADANGGGRKRRRRGGQVAEAPPAPAAPAPAPADEAQRQARAQATRAALAAVAAAAHAAHLHDDEVAAARAAAEAHAAEAPASQLTASAPAAEAAPAQTAPGEIQGPEVPATFAAPAAPEAPTPRLGLPLPPAQAPGVAAPPVSGHGAPAVLTIGGERIQLPHGEAPAEPPAPTPTPILSLDDLSHAFDQLTGERHTPSEGERPGRRRRSRGARSGQGSAEVTRVEQSSGAVGGQTRSAAAPAKPQPTEPGHGPDEGDGPLILGVGVPASEL